MIFTTQKEIDACVAKWQKILRLQDWQITAKIVPASAFTSRDNGAELSSRHCWKTAQLRLLDPMAWPSTDTEQDHERDIVHELLHLFTQPLIWAAEEKADKQIPEESMINLLTEALTTLDRRK